MRPPGFSHSRNRAGTVSTAPLTQTDFLLGTVVLRPVTPGEYNFETRTSFGPDQGQKMTHRGASLGLEWVLSDRWLAKSITAYRKLDTASFIDIDASEFELGDVFVGIDQSQLWVGKYLTPKLLVRYVVGIFDQAFSFGIEYQLTDNFRIEAESGETKSVDVVYKIER